MGTSYHMGARNDIFHPLDHPSFPYQTRDKRVKSKFCACRASAYIGKPASHFARTPIPKYATMADHNEGGACGRSSYSRPSTQTSTWVVDGY
eukprot:scaffold5586_cov39-Attheya_sp.AAC.1